LRRYWSAVARTRGADIIVRVTGDCPLISPELCGEVVGRVEKAMARLCQQCASSTFPKGMDCEAFTLANFLQCGAQKLSRRKIASMSRLGCSEPIKRVNVRSPWPIDGRLTLDTEDDYKVICAAFGHEPYQHLRAA
jgi:spore coat polysaccharide biosynthesis protein SpsF (cytidylyltransferase family)